MHVSLSQLRAGLWSIVILTRVSRPCSVGSVSRSALYCVIYTQAYSFEAPRCLLTWSVHNIQYLNYAVVAITLFTMSIIKPQENSEATQKPGSLTQDLACSFLFVLCSLFLSECLYSVSRETSVFFSGSLARFDRYSEVSQHEGLKLIIGNTIKYFLIKYRLVTNQYGFLVASAEI